MRQEYQHITPTAAFEGLTPLAEGDVLVKGEILVSLMNQGSKLRKGDVAVVLADCTVRNKHAAIPLYNCRAQDEDYWYSWRFARGKNTTRDEAL